MKPIDHLYQEIKRLRKDPGEVMLPNYYCFGWEMDYLRITNKNLVVEYEVKTSRSDFRNDFKKGDKHQLLKAGKAANRFWFVTTYQLVRPDELPDYCGLMQLNALGEALEVVKPAPLIHKAPFTAWQKLAVGCSWREERVRVHVTQLKLNIWQLQQKLKNLQNGKND